MNITKPSFYGYGAVEDEPFAGPCNTFEEAVAEAFDNYDEAESVWICEGYPVNVANFIRTEWLLENIAEMAGEEVGEVVGEWLTKVPHDKIAELENMIAEWVTKNYPPNFWLAKNAKQVFRKDYPHLA